MNYLFFDIECANQFNGVAKMYSFGYQFTNDFPNGKFQSKDIIMNPEVDSWDYYVLKNFLHIPKKEIEKKGNFIKFYDQIKALLEKSNQIVFGFEIGSDLKYLYDACKRYNLENFKFNYIDIRYMIKHLENRKVKGLKFEYFNYTLSIREASHQSEADAFLTKEILRKLSEKFGVETINNYITKELKNSLDFYLEHEKQLEIKEQKKLKELEKKQNKIKIQLENNQ